MSVALCVCVYVCVYLCVCLLDGRQVVFNVCWKCDPCVTVVFLKILLSNNSSTRKLCLTGVSIRVMGGGAGEGGGQLNR